MLLILILAQPSVGAPLCLRGHDLEVGLIEDAEDGQLDHFDVLSAALVAGGVDDVEHLEYYRRLMLDRYSILLSSTDVPTDDAATLFEFLHDELLTGEYHIEYTALSRTLEEGHFNCVSATVLYFWLCDCGGLATSIIARREHVCVRIPGVPPREIEPTSPDGFHLPSESAEDATDREITFIELLGKIFYNRALVELEEGRFPEAIGLLSNSLRLDPLDRSALENLLATFNNWALAEADAGRHEAAVDILIEGQSIDETYAPLLANDLHIHQAWVLALCDQHRYAEAIERLESALERRGATPLFDEGRFAVYQLWAESLLANGHDREAQRVLQTARGRHAADPRWAAYEAAIFDRVSDLTLRGS